MIDLIYIKLQQHIVYTDLLKSETVWYVPVSNIYSRASHLSTRELNFITYKIDIKV